MLSVHVFSHLPYETLKHGPLESFSVFKFENNLKSLKRHLTNNLLNPLTSVKGFLRKKSTYVSKASGDVLPPKGTPPKLKQPLSATDFAVLILPNMYLSAKSDPNPDCYIMAKDRVLRIERIYVTHGNSIRMDCRKLKAVSAYYIDQTGLGGRAGSRFNSSSIGNY